MNLTDLLDSYLLAKRVAGYSEHTLERVRLTLNKLMREMNINNLEELNTDVILRWGDGRLRGGISCSGLYASFNSIRSFLVFLDSRGIEHQVNMSQLNCRPRYKERKALRASDIEIILNSAPTPDIATLINLLFTAGLRISEALKLTTKDILPSNEILIERSKGGKSRRVFINESLRKDLLSLREDGYLFVDRKDPNKPMNRKIAYYYCKTAYKNAGYGDYSPHCERHGYATELLSRGANLAQVSRALGHSDIATTQIYTHLVTEDIRAMHQQYMPEIATFS